MQNGLVWKVFKVKDNGPTVFYRYSIQGEIRDTGREPVPFSWTVPSLDNPTYDLSEAERV